MEISRAVEDRSGTSAPDPRTLQVHRDPPRRDVPYVPTDEAVVAAMLRFAGVCERDVVYDLGCGDGRIVTAAARFWGARGVGIDIDPQRIHEARDRARNARVADRVTFHCGSFFDADFSAATVVMLYLLPAINVKLRPKLMSELKPGSRIVANYFGMGDWRPDMTAEAHHRRLLQWIVPAWVAGTWKCVADGDEGRTHFRLTLKSHFQNVRGALQEGRRSRPIIAGRLFGDRLTFLTTDASGHSTRYACRVEGRQLRGTIQHNAIERTPHTWGGYRLD